MDNMASFRGFRIIFPFLGRWKGMNYGRFQQLLTRCAKMGIEVHVFQPPPLKHSGELSFKEAEISLPENIFLHEPHISDFLWNLRLPGDKIIKKGIYSIRVFFDIKRFAEKRDVIFWYNFPHFPLIFLKNKKIFDYADDMVAMLRSEMGRLYNPFFKTIAEVILRLMLKRSDAIMVVSTVLYDKLIKIKGGIHIIPNGVSLSEFKNPEPKRCEWRPEKGRKVVGFVGALEYFVDIELIVETAKNLPDVDFMIIGTGRQEKFLKGLIERYSLNNIKLLSAVPHAELKNCLSVMDLCWLPFKRCPVADGACPIKIFEYAAMKKPIISTRVEEMVRIGDEFINFADTEQETVSLIRDIVQRDKFYRKRALRGYEIVKERYNWDAIARRFMEILEDIDG